MKLRSRFAIFFVVLLLGLGVLLSLQYVSESQRSQSILRGELTQRKSDFEQIFNLEGTQFKTLSEDYSFWDDMVSFLSVKDERFASGTIDTGRETYGADVAQVYKKDGSLWYESVGDLVEKGETKLSQSIFSQVDTKKNAHFFVNQAGGIMEVHVTTIVPSDDPQHATPAQGYWVVGRLLNKEYISNLASLSSGQVALSQGNVGGEDRVNGDMIAFGKQLKDDTGKTTAVLQYTTSVPIVTDLNNQFKRDFFVLILAGTLFMTFLMLSLWYMVLRPMRLISTSITQQKPDGLVRLTQSSTEFGDLAKTMISFFQQKSQIEKDEFQRAELERLNEEKTAFLRVASHELNGPVANIKTFSEFLGFLIDKDENVSGDDIKKNIQRIDHQARRIDMLLTDLKTMSEGKDELGFSLEQFDFDTMIKDEVDQAQFSSEHKISLEGETKVQLYSDSRRIGQVINNLIRNAIKYSPDNKEITVRTYIEDHRVVIEIEDHGIGISSEDQKQIFERYFRANAVKDSFKGLGLGLALSKQIIDKLGGKIWVISSVGKGSSFYVSLPIVSQNNTPSEPKI